MTQAIVTKFVRATSTKGARIKATAWAGSVMVPYDHSYDRAVEAHAVAAKALASKFNWSGKYVAGGTPDGTGDSYVWVNVDSADSMFIAHEGETK